MATVTIPKSQQELLVYQVAADAGLSPQTLWGVYGAESDFGTNEGPSSKGAEGPFQFLPSTGASYGLTSATIDNFQDSLIAAANYLKHLGANSTPNSPQTLKALDSYSGGGGTTYQANVIQKGSTYNVADALTLKPTVGGTAGKILNAVGALGTVAATGGLAASVGAGGLASDALEGEAAGTTAAEAAAGSSAAANLLGKLGATGGAIAGFELFKGWIPKAALTAGLVGLALLLILTAAHRQTGVGVPHLPVPA